MLKCHEATYSLFENDKENITSIPEKEVQYVTQSVENIL